MSRLSLTAIFRFSIHRLLLLAVMIGLCTIESMADAQREIPDDNLAYPVLITLKNGSTGSGFYVNTGREIYLVTAKHVLFDVANDKLLDTALTLLSYSKDPADAARNLISLDLSILLTSGNIKPHPSEDVAVVRLFTISTSAVLASSAALPSATLPSPALPLPGVRLDSSAKSGLLTVAASIIKPLDQVLVGNDVMVFGYPTSIGLKEIPQLDSHRPLLRKGIVAGTDPEKRSIVLDCPVYFGNSGGPVLEVDREGFQTHFSVIGVISQYVPFVDTAGSLTVGMQVRSNSGYSIATPMDFVLELIK